MNYPNPFNPTTTIKYDIAEGSQYLVTLRVFDIAGREVATLVNEVKEPGRYTATFDASGFASGIYYCHLQAGTFAAA
ncbi:MAG: T9SS type A sorting domain-containing protein [Bacteroidota bacterium]